ncbi:hypothetical protein [Streptomyces sp. CBMA156]|uniref:hypothetical protein n=1 Tax=Streptomyces sp. CBMA156 TaxID=1930280 RepID=UPI00166196B8|nr:hypothetical protein [Streptomyces sp. CBMA156]MBD0677041.1 hypothetical protein [Streptomyces sp. CBMA156]
MDEGGEPACWLDRVCPECGRLRERPGPGPCESCGTGDEGAGRDGADGGSTAGNGVGSRPGEPDPGSPEA